jgi:Mycoplasma protein of unknown function, DUF285
MGYFKKVVNMNDLFNGAESFNQDLSAWSIGNVRTTTRTFFETRSFDQDVTSWGWDATELF